MSSTRVSLFLLGAKPFVVACDSLISLFYILTLLRVLGSFNADILSSVCYLAEAHSTDSLSLLAFFSPYIQGFVPYRTVSLG